MSSRTALVRDVFYSKSHLSSVPSLFFSKSQPLSPLVILFFMPQHESPRLFEAAPKGQTKNRHKNHSSRQGSLLSVNYRRQAPSLCLDATAAAIIRILVERFSRQAAYTQACKNPVRSYDLTGFWYVRQEPASEPYGGRMCA